MCNAIIHSQTNALLLLDKEMHHLSQQITFAATEIQRLLRKLDVKAKMKGLEILYC